MDEQTVRQYAEAHGQAVVSGDMAHVMADLAPSAQAEIGPVAGAMPQPVTSAEVQSIELKGDEAVVEIRYSGADKAITVRSVWQQHGARPVATGVSLV